MYTKLQIDSFDVSVNRVSSSPTFSYYSYFFVVKCKNDDWSRESRDHVRKQDLP